MKPLHWQNLIPTSEENEVDALVTAVHGIGQLAGVPTPSIDGLLGLVRLFARTRGLYQG